MEYLPFGETLVDEHLNSYNSPFKYNAKEYDAETGNYYYGARYYDPKWSIFISVDPLAEKYPNISAYAYVANNPNGTFKQQYIYKNGNFYLNNINGKKYDGRTQSVSVTMYRLLRVYRAIEKSNSDILKNQLHTLQNSDQKHYIEYTGNNENAVTADREDRAYFGMPSGTYTEFDFNKKYKDGEKSDLGIVGHEMRHQFDNDIGNMQDNSSTNDHNDPAEIRAMYNENLARDIDGKAPNTTYKGVEINQKMLANPPNNIQSNDVQK